MTGIISFDFTGKAIIVTGAARGIGRAMTRSFINAGGKVLAVDRDEEGLIATCEGLGANCISMKADIRFSEDAKNIVSNAVDAFGQLDICVNNAAVAPHASLLDERVDPRHAE